MPDLDENTKLVLRAVADRDMDGYSLAKVTQLNADELEKAVRTLASSGLLRVRGEMGGPRLLESWFQAVPGALQLAALL
jgi:hypothetical protein